MFIDVNNKFKTIYILCCYNTNTNKKYKYTNQPSFGIIGLKK